MLSSVCDPRTSWLCAADTRVLCVTDDLSPRGQWRVWNGWALWAVASLALAVEGYTGMVWEGVSKTSAICHWKPYVKNARSSVVASAPWLCTRRRGLRSCWGLCCKCPAPAKVMESGVWRGSCCYWRGSIRLGPRSLSSPTLESAPLQPAGPSRAIHADVWESL